MYDARLVQAILNQMYINKITNFRHDQVETVMSDEEIMTKYCIQHKYLIWMAYEELIKNLVGRRLCFQKLLAGHQG